MVKAAPAPGGISILSNLRRNQICIQVQSWTFFALQLNSTTDPWQISRKKEEAAFLLRFHWISECRSHSWKQLAFSKHEWLLLFRFQSRIWNSAVWAKSRTKTSIGPFSGPTIYRRSIVLQVTYSVSLYCSTGDLFSMASLLNRWPIQCRFIVEQVTYWVIGYIRDISSFFAPHCEIESWSRGK